MRNAGTNWHSAAEGHRGKGIEQPVGIQLDSVRQRLAVLKRAVSREAPPDSNMIAGHAIEEENLNAVAQDNVVG
ncbi:MAG TPA: hypothetical protein VEL48_14650 [Candidatus Acidoferrales bacterium]|nr:hypothetical protein [Candidatus Acidoferrales bacterium]